MMRCLHINRVTVDDFLTYLAIVDTTQPICQRKENATPSVFPNFSYSSL